MRMNKNPVLFAVVVVAAIALLALSLFPEVALNPKYQILRSGEWTEFYAEEAKTATDDYLQLVDIHIKVTNRKGGGVSSFVRRLRARSISETAVELTVLCRYRNNRSEEDLSTVSIVFYDKEGFEVSTLRSETQKILPHWTSTLQWTGWVPSRLIPRMKEARVYIESTNWYRDSVEEQQEDPQQESQHHK